MKVISKYILKEIGRVFLLCQCIFILIFLVIDFVQKIDNFVKAEVPFSYTLANLPDEKKYGDHGNESLRTGHSESVYARNIFLTCSKFILILSFRGNYPLYKFQTK